MVVKHTRFIFTPLIRALIKGVDKVLSMRHTEWGDGEKKPRGDQRRVIRSSDRFLLSWEISDVFTFFL